ncbi:hypothetical protein DL764_003181 [Monosporascus ibericus]|uniref:Uncharacterized protein n=1 Tax=Monosporascus ibericus TaxID=155417 RepID=A0A4Q4THP6_9PEZI|nr:hypothetical protein DL764_003181 [Monosporascus ibericus]
MVSGAPAHERCIFVNPVPEYLLDSDVWKLRLCHSNGLHRSACGLLLPYAWLIRSKSDIRIAHDTGLLPTDIKFDTWTAFIADFTAHVDTHSLHQVEPRYGYGKLWLTRLNTLYLFGAAGFSLRNLVHSFFERKFGRILAVFVYITVVLSAMQVALATERFQNDTSIQAFSYGVALMAVGLVLGAISIMLLPWWSLF